MSRATGLSEPGVARASGRRSGPPSRGFRERMAPARAVSRTPCSARSPTLHPRGASQPHAEQGRVAASDDLAAVAQSARLLPTHAFASLERVVLVLLERPNNPLSGLRRLTDSSLDHRRSSMTDDGEDHRCPLGTTADAACGVAAARPGPARGTARCPRRGHRKHPDRARSPSHALTVRAAVAPTRVCVLAVHQGSTRTARAPSSRDRHDRVLRRRADAEPAGPRGARSSECRGAAPAAAEAGRDRRT